MLKRQGTLWRGLTMVFTFMLTLSMILGTILETYKSAVNDALGTQSEIMVSDGENDNLYSLFTPSAQVLNADGTLNSTALIQKAIDLNRKQAAEGTVLLKNENHVLPLETGSKVTLLGIRSHESIIGAGMGQRANGPYISLEQALSENRTNFAETLADNIGSWSGAEFDFEGAGFEINPVMVEIYETLNENYGHHENVGVAEEYNPREISLDEIASANPNYKDSFATYGDAAIVVISRPSAEGTDYQPGGVTEENGASEPLALSTNEKATIELAKECSDKVIVLVNTTNAIEIGELADDPEIDAILWIGFPGCYGMLGVADVLCGRENPSGGLSDTFATYNLSAPAMQNMGDFEYSNADEITRSSSKNYLIEAEGIYVGYRYYETRYYDAVLGQGNASSPVGAYASTTKWDYDNEVVYSFGYGLSYTDFEMEWDGEPVWDITYDKETGVTNAYVTFNVKVTNVGDKAGKQSVQIYGQAPYITGGVEKSAVQLLNYDKTDILKPGESQTLSVKVDMQYIASYDEKYDNGDGTYGTYILDPGKYYFSYGNGAHDALNNILAAQGYSETDGMDYNGSSEDVYVQEITEDFISRTAFSVSKNGTKINNQLQNSDWNYFQKDEVTYLSRSDWAGTFPKRYENMTVINAELKDLLNGKYYAIKTDEDTSEIVWGKDNGVLFYEMAGLSYDDEKWNELLDQMTLEEAQYLATFGGPSIPGAPSIGTVEASLTENAGNGVSAKLNTSRDTSAPWTVSEDDPNASWDTQVLGSSTLTACTFNPALVYELGAFVGEESLIVGIPILWGPGLNLHRHAYNGRNNEYYSEDPILTGVCGMEFSLGALEYGLIAAPKHYAFNDQETHRIGVAPYMTEQKARELELRGYQIAIEATKYDTEEEDASMLGLMVSLSKIGPVECTTSYGLMTKILKDEWGFRGYAVTDIFDDMDVYGAVLLSGTTCFDTRGLSGFYTNTTLEASNFANQVDGSVISSTVLLGDASLQKAVKESAHGNLYALSKSHLMNRYSDSTRLVSTLPWWRLAYYIAIGVSALLTVLCAVKYVIVAKKNNAGAEAELWGRNKGGSFVTAIGAGIMGVISFVAIIVCSTTFEGYAPKNLSLVLVGVIAGTILCIASGWIKNQYIKAGSVLLSILIFATVFGNIVIERILLITGLFSYDANNTVGWNVFYVSVVALASILVAIILQIVGSFMTSKEKLGNN